MPASPLDAWNGADLFAIWATQNAPEPGFNFIVFSCS